AVDFSGNVQNVGATLYVRALTGNSPPVNFHNTPITVTNLILNGVALTSGPIQAFDCSWAGGMLNGTGAVTVSDSLMLGPGTGDETLDGRTLENLGTALWIDDGSNNSSIHLINAAVFNNHAGATFTIQNETISPRAGSYTNIDGDGLFNN